MQGTFSKPATYLLFVVAGLVAGLVLALRSNGLFSCRADGYSPNRYLAYCAGDHYGDYDHGALWFGLQPAVREHVRNADVVILGNSRVQVGLSSPATDAWFAAANSKYYLLGFMFEERMAFAQEILQKLEPKAKVYVINIDSFFRDWLSQPAEFAISDPEALSRYREKKRWQGVHRAICGGFSSLCGNKGAWFRAVETGAFDIDYDSLDATPVGEDMVLDEAEVRSEVALAERFLARLNVPRECVLFTLVPYNHTPVAAANAIAAALDVRFVAPQLDGLMTADRAHLDAPSAERWSAEFLREAGPVIKSCLDKSSSSQ